MIMSEAVRPVAFGKSSKSAMNFPPFFREKINKWQIEKKHVFTKINVKKAAS